MLINQTEWLMITGIMSLSFIFAVVRCVAPRLWKIQVLTELNYQTDIIYIYVNAEFFWQVQLASIVAVKRRLTDDTRDNTVIRAVNAVII